MTTMFKKTKPLAVLALMMAFFLTGCDAVLETFYPEFAQGGSFSAKSLEVSVSVDWAVDDNVYLALVPFYNVNGNSSPDSFGVVTRSINPADLDPSDRTWTVNDLFLDPSREYEIIVYVEDPTNPGKPYANMSSATVVPVNGKGTFNVSDLPDGPLWASISPYVFAPEYLYFQVFAGSTGGDGNGWLNTPWNYDLNSDPYFDLSYFSFQRPWTDNMKAIEDMNVVITHDGNEVFNQLVPIDDYQAYSDWIGMPGQRFDQWGFGSYVVTVNYNIDGLWYDTMTSFYLSGGSGDNGLAAGSYVQTTINVVSWTDANFNGVYYADFYIADPWGSLSYVGSSYDTNTVIGPIGYTYTPGQYLVAIGYDSSFNYLGYYYGDPNHDGSGVGANAMDLTNSYDGMPFDSFFDFSEIFPVY